MRFIGDGGSLFIRRCLSAASAGSCYINRRIKRQFNGLKAEAGTISGNTDEKRSRKQPGKRGSGRERGKSVEQR